jgi:hypothetical protein
MFSVPSLPVSGASNQDTEFDKDSGAAGYAAAR